MIEPDHRNHSVTCSTEVDVNFPLTDHGLGYDIPISINEDISVSSESSTESSCRNSRSSSIKDDESETEALTGREDTIIAAKLRMIVVALFVSMSVCVPIVIYITTRRNEVDSFEASFLALAVKVISAVDSQLARKISAVDSLRIAVTSHALNTNASWPFVTIPDFDLRAESARDLGNIPFISLHPLVSLDDREEWEQYSVDNIDWLWQAKLRQPTAASELSEQRTQLANFSRGFSKEIYQIDPHDHEAIVDQTTGPYLPTWQHMPPFEQVINRNNFALPLQKTLMEGDAVISRTSNDNQMGPGFSSVYSSFLNQNRIGDTKREYEGEPVARMYYPIFDTFESETSKLVGMISAAIIFEMFLAGVLGPNSNGIICVFENTCGDEFSFQINGEEAAYLGPGDFHDRNYDYIEQSYDFSVVGKTHSYSEKTVGLNDEYCPYSMRVYPLDELHQTYVTNQPIVYAITMALVIMFISIVSMSYDYFVQRKIRRVLKNAKESRAIVSSLFPANVRDRLLRDEEERKSTRRGSLDSRRSTENNSCRNGNESGITEMFPFSTAMAGFAALAPPRLRLKFFLNEDKSNSVHNYPVEPSECDEESDYMQQGKPIADLFPHCTVLFADIAGFTAWSSEREPEQVFTLLQTIFQTFDALARKRDIFKVETIGDCYVAVTGLPDPQVDHAVRMTKYTRACMQKVAEVTKHLELKLGPGTGNLRMRFGLHSGPVTAGVLRGEKSRFQLFGDTVNTASRMESTGQRNRIQVSQSTAQLLIEAGKENWIQPRDDVVHAKGKGAIQTYWVLTRRQSPSVDGQSDHRPKFLQATLSTQESTTDGDSVGSENGSVWGDDEELSESITAVDLPNVSLKGQYDRLIDWQVDLMLKLLKQIVTVRDYSTLPLSNPTKVVARDCIVLEEVSESIELPEFDPKAAKLRARPSLVEVPEEVVTELREYVRMVADRYRDNPFHNFAHANHVTMSANKLLSRIVKPEDVNYHRKSVKAIASDLHDYTYGINSDPLTQLAIIFSTLIHDVDHTGVSNGQRNKENPELAEKYRQRSVAEQNSVDVAWELLMEPQFENLQRCIFATDSELSRFRQLLVNLVMATDIFDKEMKATRDMRWEKVFHSDLGNSVKDSEFRSLKAMIVIEHIIQAADVAHTMQHWHVYKKWNSRLFQEMYLAYENGRSEKDPSEGWYNGELWFFDNYVIPLARKLEECGVFGVAGYECLNYALENRKEWAVKGKEIVQEMVEDFKLSREAAVDCIVVLASQEDEIVFLPNSLPPDSPQEEKSNSKSRLLAVSPMLSDMSPSLKTSSGISGIRPLLPPAPDLNDDPVLESVPNSNGPIT